MAEEGIHLPAFYWQGHAEQARAYQAQVTAARERMKKAIRERVKKHAGKKSRGRPPSIVKRSGRISLYILEESKVDACELAGMRGVGDARLAGNIVEQVVWLWRHRFRYDPTLFLRRCEDPTEADIEIRADAEAANLDILHPKERMEYYLLAFVNAAVVLQEECEFPLEALIAELRKAMAYPWRKTNQPNQHTSPDSEK